jgi:hypothetical protein
VINFMFFFMFLELQQVQRGFAMLKQFATIPQSLQVQN